MYGAYDSKATEKKKMEPEYKKQQGMQKGTGLHNKVN
jgi:hypothetical protein